MPVSDLAASFERHHQRHRIGRRSRETVVLVKRLGFIRNRMNKQPANAHDVRGWWRRLNRAKRVIIASA